MTSNVFFLTSNKFLENLEFLSISFLENNFFNILSYIYLFICIHVLFFLYSNFIVTLL